MRFNTHIIAAGAAALALTTGACSPNWKVKRIDPEKTVDLDYRFDDEDARSLLSALTDMSAFHHLRRLLAVPADGKNICTQPTAVRHPRRLRQQVGAHTLRA